MLNDVNFFFPSYFDVVFHKCPHKKCRKFLVYVFSGKNGDYRRKEAVNYLRVQNKFPLVLMDIQMPVMDGITATEEIRKINKEIPIVIQTSFALDKIKEKAFESGCTDFITKPITLDLLIPKIEECLYSFS